MIPSSGDADGKRTPLPGAHQGQREASQPWYWLAIEAGKEAIEPMGVLARFGGYDFIADQQVDFISTVEMLTKEHPKQHGPRQYLGEKALHRPITAAWARPAGDAQHRHASRHDQQSRHNTAQLAQSRYRYMGSEALAKCYNVHWGFFVG